MKKTLLGLAIAGGVIGALALGTSAANASSPIGHSVLGADIPAAAMSDTQMEAVEGKAAWRIRFRFPRDEPPKEETFTGTMSDSVSSAADNSTGSGDATITVVESPTSSSTSMTASCTGSCSISMSSNSSVISSGSSWSWSSWSW